MYSYASMYIRTHAYASVTRPYAPYASICVSRAHIHNSNHTIPKNKSNMQKYPRHIIRVVFGSKLLSYSNLAEQIVTPYIKIQRNLGECH